MQKPIRNRALIVGAGLSGLAAAKALRAQNVPFTLLEGRDRVAEPWRARHPQLRLNIHRHFASLPGLAMPSDDGTFVRRDTVVDYLEDYARGLGVDIQFGTQVTSVERTPTGWRVATNHGEHRCEHLIVATGRESVPHVPDWPGRDRFQGELKHAAAFGDVAQYAGRKVLVIGAGNSGTDALNHLARADPAQVWVSVRHGPAILPSRVFGFPLHRLAKLFGLLPKKTLDPAFGAIQRLAFGDLKRFGLPSHPDGGGTRMLRDGITFALDDGFVASLKQGRCQVVASTVGFERDSVRLADGSRLTPDVVICATGYRTDLETLFGGMGVLDAPGHPTHPMGEADARHPGLWFTGYRPEFTGFFHAAGVTARRIAQAVAEGPPKPSQLRQLQGGEEVHLDPNPSREALT